MSVFSRIKDIFVRQRVTQPTKPQTRFFFTGKTQAGVKVNHDLALTCSAVWACVRIISETIASLPWHSMVRKGKNVEVDEGSEVDELLSRSPNPEMTPFTLREKLLHDVLLWGNGYAEIARNSLGVAEQMWPLNAEEIEIVRDEDGRIVYIHRHSSTGK